MKTLLLFLTLTTFAPAQTWITVAQENQAVVNNTTPITFRFGTPAGVAPTVAGAVPCTTVGGCWDAPLVVNAVTTTIASVAAFKTDPVYGTVKVLQVLETAVAQTVTVAGVKVTVPANVPTPPPVPPITFSCPGTATGTLTGTVISNLTFNQTGNCTTQ